MATKHIETAQPLPTRAQVQQYVAAMLAANPTAVPPDFLTQEDMTEWYEAQTTLERVKAQEMTLRLKIFKHYFPDPKEGTNDVRLPDGFVVKAQYKITRDVDQASIDSFKKLTVGDVREKLEQLQMDPAAVPAERPLHEFLKLKLDELIKYDPALAIREYRKLTAEQAAFFESCLNIRPGAPSIKIVPPSAKSEAEAA